MVGTFKATGASSTGYGGRAGEDLSEPSSGLPETAGETGVRLRAWGLLLPEGEGDGI